MKLREELGETFYVTKGLDNCLFAYAPEDWKELEAKLKALPLSKSRDLQRFFFSSAVECRCDSQGRILVPSNLREYAFLEKDLCITGVSNRAEIWDAERWRAYNGNLSENPDKIAKAMEDIGF